MRNQDIHVSLSVGNRHQGKSDLRSAVIRHDLQLSVEVKEQVLRDRKIVRRAVRANQQRIKVAHDKTGERGRRMPRPKYPAYE